MKWRYGAVSDIGRRRARNEDAWLALEASGIFAVADGMGGHAGGDEASRLAIAALRAALGAGSPLPRAEAGARLADAFAAAGRAIAAAVAERPAFTDMGTTLAAVALDAEARDATLAHVGDSRIYRLRRGALELMTRDHTWVQQQVDAGLLTVPEARRHPRAPLLMRVLDGHGGGLPDIMSFELEAGDTLLLCTDGLSGPVRDEELAAILDLPLEPDAIARRLAEAANARGGPDNITAVVIRRAD